jgi:WD40-like Beta Propeller Repeat
MPLSERIPALLTLVTACGFPRPSDVTSEVIDAAQSTPDAIDHPVDLDASGAQARCDPSKPFGMPRLVDNVNSSLDEYSFSFTPNEQTAFVGRTAVQGPSTIAILATRRASTTVAFDVPNAGTTSAINGGDGDVPDGSPSFDGLILYFARLKPSDVEIFAATRSDGSASFDAGTHVTVDGADLIDALSPTITPDGQTLYWRGFLGNDYGKVFSATRNNGPTTFVNKRAVSTISTGFVPVLSADELTMFYTDGNATDVLASTRTSKGDMFGTGVPVANVNSTANDIPVALTNDGCVLYIRSQRSGGLGGYDIWEAHRPQ